MARELARDQPASTNHALLGDRRLLRTIIAAASLGGDEQLFDGTAVSTLTVSGTETEPSTFEATVSEHIVPTPIPSADEASQPAGPAVEDAVEERPRRYVFTGRLVDLRIDGPATVRVDGERVDPKAFGN